MISSQAHTTKKGAQLTAMNRTARSGTRITTRWGGSPAACCATGHRWGPHHHETAAAGECDDKARPPGGSISFRAHSKLGNSAARVTIHSRSLGQGCYSCLHPTSTAPPPHHLYPPIPPIPPRCCYSRPHPRLRQVHRVGHHWALRGHGVMYCWSVRCTAGARPLVLEDRPVKHKVPVPACRQGGRGRCVRGAP